MNQSLIKLLDTAFYARLTPTHVITALALLLAAFLGSRIVSRVLVRLSSRFEPHTFKHALADAAARPSKGALLIAGLWAALMVILERCVEDWSSSQSLRYLVAALIPFVVWGLLLLVSNLAGMWQKHAERTDSAFDDQLVPIVHTTVRLFVLLMGALTFLQALNYPVGSLLAGLGIGGMAIALAAKDTLANLFGSLVILVDRPFTVGDWVEIGEYEGTVEEVGLRVTRIRTFANSLISIPNGGLTTQAVNNWSKMRKRRISLTVGITYDASPEAVEKAVERLRQVLEEHPQIISEGCIVNLNNFGPSSLDIFVYCFTQTTVWAQYLQARQRLLLTIMRELRAMGLSLAFPTQTLHLHPSDHTATKQPL